MFRSIKRARGLLPNALRNQIAAMAPDSTVRLSILRDNREQQLNAQLGEFRAETAANGNGNSSTAPKNMGKLGITVEPLTPEAKSRLEVGATTRGVVVGEVDPVGPAARAGIERLMLSSK